MVDLEWPERLARWETLPPRAGTTLNDVSRKLTPPFFVLAKKMHLLSFFPPLSRQLAGICLQLHFLFEGTTFTPMLLLLRTRVQSH